MSAGAALRAPVDLRCGDARAVLATVPDACMDLVVTSPPYNLGASPSARAHPWSSRGTDLDWEGYEDDPDALPEPVYQAEQRAVLAELYRVAKPGASCFYVHKDRRWDGQLISPLVWLYHTPWHLRQQLVWDRLGGHEMAGHYFLPQHEYIFWLVKGASAGLRWPDARLGSVWQIAIDPRKSERPAMWPLELPRRCILAASRPGDWVCDPYCGSGQAGVAAVMAGRHFLGSDRSPAAIALATRRIAAVSRVDDLPLFAALEGRDVG